MPQAYAFTAFGGPEVETFLRLPVPDPAAGRLLIKVRAAGVNPVDWKKRTGYRVDRVRGTGRWWRRSRGWSATACSGRT